MWKHFENIKMGSRREKKELTSITLGNDALIGVHKAKDKKKNKKKQYKDSILVKILFCIGIWISHSETTCIIGLIK